MIYDSVNLLFFMAYSSRELSQDQSSAWTETWGFTSGTARKSWPYPSKFWLQRAMRNRALNGTDPKREVECWHELLEFFPEDAFALRTLAFILCDEEKAEVFDPKEGLEVALRVVEKTGRDDPWTGHVLARGFSHEALAVQTDILAAIEGGAEVPCPTEAVEAARDTYRQAVEGGPAEMSEGGEEGN
jgi:hypothetical protein